MDTFLPNRIVAPPPPADNCARQRHIHSHTIDPHDHFVVYRSAEVCRGSLSPPGGWGAADGARNVISAGALAAGLAGRLF